MRKYTFIAILVALAGGLATALMYDDARVVAEKIVTALAMPYGIIWLLSLLACLWAAYREEKGLLRLSLLMAVLIYVGGNGLIAKWCMRSLEAPYLEYDPLKGRPPALLDARSAVLLGGGTGVRPGGGAELSLAGDRLFLAAQLFHAGKIDRIICTGTRIRSLDRSGRDPHETARELLENVGVPRTATESVEGRTTSEEMRSLAKTWDAGRPIGIITSAWHMSRAVRLAKSAGLNAIPLPADFRSPDDMRPNVLDFVPDTYAAESIRLACKEWLARIVGR